MLQDPETWGREGLVDFIVPMMYYRDDLYSPFLREWKEQVARYIPSSAGLHPTAWRRRAGLRRSSRSRSQRSAKSVSLAYGFFRESAYGSTLPSDASHHRRSPSARQLSPLPSLVGRHSKQQRLPSWLSSLLGVAKSSSHGSSPRHRSIFR